MEGIISTSIEFYRSRSWPMVVHIGRLEVDLQKAKQRKLKRRNNGT